MCSGTPTNMDFDSMIFRATSPFGFLPSVSYHPATEVDMKSIDALREMKDKLQTALKASGSMSSKKHLDCFWRVLVVKEQERH